MASMGSDPYAEITARFPTTEAAEDFLERVRWPVQITCPACGRPTVGWKREQHRADRFQCGSCARSFSVTAGTFLAGTHMDLRVWFRFLQAPDCTSGVALARILDVRRPTVATMRRRVRGAATDRLLGDLRRALRR